MIHSDTIKLLRECDAGVRMGVKSIDDVLHRVSSEEFRKALVECRQDHVRLQEEIQAALDRFHDDGKEPNVMAKTMSAMKTSMKMAMEDSDQTIADLITDGCNMGVKSLNRYLNQYEAADETAKDITKRLIKQEEKLLQEIRKYL